MLKCDKTRKIDGIVPLYLGNFMHKPIIGIIGGIGSGKSFVASLFQELGGCVIRSDDLVHEVYARPQVKSALRQWWGESVFKPDGSVDRKAVARRVFEDPDERARLEQLIHPLVDQERLRIMEHKQKDPQVKAFVWDTPLLIETGLQERCDAVIFVDAPWEVRLQRVMERGWDASELRRRENSQLPLDKKREISDYIVSNASDTASARSQVRQIFSQIESKISGSD